VQTFTLTLPALYADHHVTEVRRILLALEGVQDVYASSAFQLVEVQYDEGVLAAEAIQEALAAAGYTGELPVPAEVGALAEKRNGDRPFFRHTAVYPAAGRAVSFAQDTPAAGRPLWPCPGMGPIAEMEE
jgi:copper chaperone CopZ